MYLADVARYVADAYALGLVDGEQLRQRHIHLLGNDAGITNPVRVFFIELIHQSPALQVRVGDVRYEARIGVLFRMLRVIVRLRLLRVEVRVLLLCTRFQGEAAVTCADGFNKTQYMISDSDTCKDIETGTCFKNFKVKCLSALKPKVFAT